MFTNQMIFYYYYVLNWNASYFLYLANLSFSVNLPYCPNSLSGTIDDFLV